MFCEFIFFVHLFGACNSQTELVVPIGMYHYNKPYGATSQTMLVIAPENQQKKITYIFAFTLQAKGITENFEFHVVYSESDTPDTESLNKSTRRTIIYKVDGDKFDLRNESIEVSNKSDHISIGHTYYSLTSLILPPKLLFAFIRYLGAMNAEDGLSTEFTAHTSTEDEYYAEILKNNSNFVPMGNFTGTTINYKDNPDISQFIDVQDYIRDDDLESDLKILENDYEIAIQRKRDILDQFKPVDLPNPGGSANLISPGFNIPILPGFGGVVPLPTPPFNDTKSKEGESGSKDQRNMGERNRPLLIFTSLQVVLLLIFRSTAGVE